MTNLPAAGRLTAFGECMIEFSRSGDGATWARKFAGDTFNTAWYFKRLAAPAWSAAYFTCVGDDAPSRDLTDFIEATGVETRFVQPVAGASPGLYVIDLDGAERHFSYWRETSAARHLAADSDRMIAAMGESDIIYFSGITLAILPEADRASFLACLATARSAGRTIAFDPNIRPRLWPERDRLRHAVAQAAGVSTIVFPTFDDDQPVFGDTGPRACAERYRSYGADLAIVKNGPSPCIAVSQDGIVEVPAAAVDTPRDTTGAGDSFNAGFLAARTFGYAVPEALRFAHAVASRTICGYGALVEPPDELRLRLNPV